MSELLKMGPPVYFALSTTLNFNEYSNQNLLCGGQLCNTDSIITQLYLASKDSVQYVSIEEIYHATSNDILSHSQLQYQSSKITFILD